jgi:hypothetical protein
MTTSEDFSPGETKPTVPGDTSSTDTNHGLPVLNLVSISQESTVARRDETRKADSTASTAAVTDAAEKSRPFWSVAGENGRRTHELTVPGRDGSPLKIGLEMDLAGKVSIKVPPDVRTYETLASLLNPDGRSAPRPNSKVEFSGIEVGKDGEVTLFKQMDNNCELKISLRTSESVPGSAVLTNADGCSVEYDQRGLAAKVVDLDSQSNRMRVYTRDEQGQWHSETDGNASALLKNFTVFNGAERGQWKLQYDLDSDRQTTKALGGEVTVRDLRQEREDAERKTKEAAESTSWTDAVKSESPAQLIARLLNENLTEDKDRYVRKVIDDQVSSDLYWQGAEKVRLQFKEMTALYAKEGWIDKNQDGQWTREEIAAAQTVGGLDGKTHQMLKDMDHYYKLMSNAWDGTDGISGKDLATFARAKAPDENTYLLGMQTKLNTLVATAEIGFYRGHGELVVRDHSTKKTISIKLSGPAQFKSR